MFLLTGYEYFLGFLLIAAAVPILALVTNLIVAPKGRTGEENLHTNLEWSLLEEHGFNLIFVITCLP